jgi:hypothetical protein
MRNRKPSIRTISFLFFLSNFSFSLFSQIDSSQNPIAINQIVDGYNLSRYERIFDSFSIEMKNAIPNKDTAAFFSQLKTDYGVIESVEHKRFSSPYNFYKVTFHKGTLLLKIAFNEKYAITGLVFDAYADDPYPIIERSLSSMILPFQNEWDIAWGGDTEAQNYHVAYTPQKNVFDFVIRDSKGRSYKTNGKKNEDYYAYNQPVISPCEGEILLVVDGIPDNAPGAMNPMYAPGNSVVIGISNGEYIFLGHFIPYSMKVKKGTPLGLCGNSGKSSEPHIHFLAQNSPDINSGTGIKVFFTELFVNSALKKDYSPIQNEKVKNGKF